MKKAIKSGNLTIKYGLNQILIAADDDTSASESVGSSEFEYTTSTYSPVLAELSFHVMDRHEKLKFLDTIGKSIHCPTLQQPIPNLQHPSIR